MGAFSQITVTSAKVPAFMQGVNGTNNSRVSFWFWGELSGLTPGATYRFYTSMDSLTASPTSNGAGNPLLINMISSTVRRSTGATLSNFTGCDSILADGSGNYKGWFGVEPSGNARFTPGKTLYPKLVLNNGAGGTAVATRLLFSAFPVKIINFGLNSGNVNEGSAVYDSIPNGSVPAKSFVFLYDNNTGSGRPVSCAIVENDGMDLAAITSIATFYRNSVDAKTRIWGTIIPNSLAGGINLVEVRDFVNTSTLQTYSLTLNDGVWCTLNTVNPSNGSIGLFLHAFALPPSINVFLSQNLICEGDSSVLTATSSATIATYTVNPGSLSGATQTLIPSSTTPYSVIVEDNYGCQNNASITLTVIPKPILDLSLSNNVICEGNSSVLTGTTNAASPTFTVNPGNLSGMTQTLSPSSATTYSAYVTDNVTGCSARSLITLFVNPLPTLILSLTDSLLCDGFGNSVLTGTTNAASPNFTVNPGDLSTITQTVSPPVTTTYSVIVEDLYGCINTAAITLTVVSIPTLTLSLSSTQICNGDSVVLTASSSATAPNYTINPGGFSIPTQTVHPSVTTTYSVNVSDYGCENNGTIMLTIYQLPTISVATTSSILCTGETATLTASGTSSTYTWSTGNNSPSIIVTPTTTTDYTISGTSNQCSTSVVVTQTVDLCTGIATIQTNENAVSVFPNPNNGQFTISSQNSDNATFYIYNQLGELVKHQTLNTNQTVIDTELSDGVYHVKVLFKDNSTFVTKIVINQ